VNSLPKTVTRRRRGCDLNPGPSAPESTTLTTRLPSHPFPVIKCKKINFQRESGTGTVRCVCVCVCVCRGQSEANDSFLRSVRNGNVSVARDHLDYAGVSVAACNAVGRELSLRHTLNDASQSFDSRPHSRPQKSCKPLPRKNV